MAATDTPTSNPITRRLAHVEHIVLIMSGKGGVGKSSSTVQLALTLHAQGHRVGVLDTDLTGPSIPRMLGLDGQGVHQSTDGWVPVYADGSEGRLAVMSVGFLLKSSRDSVVWRGPKKEGMIKQFLGDVRWGKLDYLLIDTPPGTSDEHLSLMTHLHPLLPRLSSIIITTPQAVSLLDTIKSLNFTRKVGLPVLGLVENMSGYACPCCGDVTYLFGQGGGESMCAREGLKFLGRGPVEADLVSLLDATVAAVKDAADAREVDNGATTTSTADTLSATSAETAAAPIASGGVTPPSTDVAAAASPAPFDVGARYQKTLSYKLFRGIAAEVVRLLDERRAAQAAHPTGEGEAEVLTA